MPWGAAELAARQEAVDLVNAQPELWPLLNQLTLSDEHEGIRNGVKWCATLRLLEHRVAQQQQRASHTVTATNSAG